MAGVLGLLRNVLLVVEMLQLISIALEPAFTDFGDPNINEGTCDKQYTK